MALAVSSGGPPGAPHRIIVGALSYDSVRAWAGPSGGFGETTGRTAEKSLRSKSKQSTSAVREVTLLKVLDDDAHAGKNNGFAGTAPHQQDIKMTGTAVWAVREDGKLLSNHVERAALEQVQRLTATTS